MEEFDSWCVVDGWLLVYFHMTDWGYVVVVHVVPHGCQFLWHLEEFDLWFVVVVGMIGNCVMVVMVLVVVEVAGHLVVTDPIAYRVALVLVEVPPVW